MLMKKVKITYFKTSGKYYTSEEIEIPSNLHFWEAVDYIEERLRIKTMFALAENVDGDDKIEPYIVPHLFHPQKREENY